MPHVRVVVLNCHHEYSSLWCTIARYSYSVKQQIGDENSDPMQWKEKAWNCATMPIGKIDAFDEIKDHWNAYNEQVHQYFIANEINEEKNVGKGGKKFSKITSHSHTIRWRWRKSHSSTQRSTPTKHCTDTIAGIWDSLIWQRSVDQILKGRERTRYIFDHHHRKRRWRASWVPGGSTE